MWNYDPKGKSNSWKERRCLKKNRRLVFSLVPFSQTESELWSKIFRLKSGDKEWQWNHWREYIGSHIVFQYGRWQEVEKFRYYCLRQTQHCTVIIASHFVSRPLPVSLSSSQTRGSSFIFSLISCFHEETRTGTSYFMLLSSHCCSISHFFPKPFLLPILSLSLSHFPLFRSLSSHQFLFYSMLFSPYPADFLIFFLFKSQTKKNSTIDIFCFDPK